MDMRIAVLLGLVTSAALAAVTVAETFVWIDEDGTTHITDDPARVPPHAGRGADALRDLWRDSRSGEVPPGDPKPADDRASRLIAGAVEDLRRGETARASVALEDVLRDRPAHPEAHWYLALLDRQRGRYESARVHLEAFLSAAGDDLEPWRQSARRRIRALRDEARLEDPTRGTGSQPWRGLTNPHFRVNYDPELARSSPDFAKTVMGYLEQARSAAHERLGSVPVEAMGVVFYGKAAYMEAHRHRFSFQTVGFFDGRIHVVSAAHPAGELRALLFHEYTHAVYREKTGGDRPYWLNEGLAELTERASVSREGLTRSERAALRMRIDSGGWLPLRRLAPSFSGLDDGQARTAYLESAAAAHWIGTRTSTQQRARLLSLLGQGRSADAALREVLGVDTDGVDAAVRNAIREGFPSEFATEALRPAPAKLREAAP
jgi:hypothetical protein